MPEAIAQVIGLFAGFPARRDFVSGFFGGGVESLASIANII
jgi:hypothetical protein